MKLEIVIECLIFLGLKFPMPLPRSSKLLIDLLYFLSSIFVLIISSSPRIATAQTTGAENTVENNPDLQIAWILTIGMGIGAIAVHWGLGWLRSRLLQVVHHRTPDTNQPGEKRVKASLELFFKLSFSAVRIGLWIAVALSITQLFPITRRWSAYLTNRIVDSLTTPILTLGSRAYSITHLLFLAVLLFGLVMAVSILTNVLRSRVFSLANIDRGLQEAILILTKYGLITIGTLVLLQIWGLDISSLAILASALSVGIGFGLQDIAKNFGSGLVLVFERPIQIGDFVEVGKFQGTVERIGARSTEIRTLDHVSIIVPNSRFLESEVINWSHRNPRSRLHLPVGVTYSADPEVVATALLEAAQNHPDVLQNPTPHVLFKGFGESALQFELLVWTNTPNRQFLLRSDLNYQIFKCLRKRQIEIPFPQQDLHLRSGKLEVSPQLESAFVHLSTQLSDGLLSNSPSEERESL